jgi:hypothetical protein
MCTCSRVNSTIVLGVVESIVDYWCILHRVCTCSEREEEIQAFRILHELLLCPPVGDDVLLSMFQTFIR